VIKYVRLPPAYDELYNTDDLMTKHFKDRQTFDAVKIRVLKAIPDDKELSPMLRALSEKATELGDWNEIQQLVNNENYPESKKNSEQNSSPTEKSHLGCQGGKMAFAALCSGQTFLYPKGARTI
jgi:hypothetical protein